MLAQNPEKYTTHLKFLPVRRSDTSPTEFKLGDFMVHFYACHGKELYEGFDEFEKKYGYVLDNFEKKYL